MTKLPLTIFPLLFLGAPLNAAESDAMTPDKLLEAIKANAEDVESDKNVVSFNYQGVALYCVYDVKADRMRIISPIADVAQVGAEALIIAMQANYHTVLDARYAIGDDIVYSAFIHPLSPLTVGELVSAIRQVATAAATFGDQYTSGELVFPGNAQPEDENKGKIKPAVTI